ncbi:amidohydrolase family protein [Streptomyces subrutilus]|uniref:Amidohydrolase n=1 Tax=Streptomyces subrutilus TaxID=36818 RepID=A0A5P2ULU0_9ACTN|nr:amidohydrolase family protein [Streptomyces subrutilus]QEU77607.1 amidohydrolase [Streptomyces subrutilus]WSJ33297.1 amidohydrolase [Streptomyces subrutilus]GGZ64605.1 amidohydrolase [Streptomyces subrutilus]
MQDSASTSELPHPDGPVGAPPAAVADTGDRARLEPGALAPGPGAVPGSPAKIDMHHHYCAPEWREWAVRHGLVKAEHLPPWSRLDTAASLRFMDAAGITTAVLKPMLPARYQSSAQLREAIAITLRSMIEVAGAHPGRFAFYVPLFLDDHDASSWAIRRGIGQLGAVGVNVTANYGGVYLGDPAYDRLFAELNDCSAVVDTHPHNLPGGPPGAATVPGVPNFMCDFLLDTTRAAVNMIARRTLDRFPDLSVILPHAGGFLPYIATRMRALGRFCDPPVDPGAVADHLRRFYYDTAGPMAPAATLLAHVPADHVLFGTDWPAAPADTVTELALPELEADPSFTPEQVRGVYHDNALRLIPQLATV